MRLGSILATAALPGWFGKLPGMGDFAHRRLPAGFRNFWDDWLQDGLGGLRARHTDWRARYLEAPLWYFALGAGSVDAGSWLGVLMPSVDAVGRCFPLTLATPFTPAIAAGDDMNAWWQRAAAAALEALDADLDAGRFDELLARRFAAAQPERPAWTPAAAPLTPLPGESMWRTAARGGAGDALALSGLPLGSRFDALFGCLPQPWSEFA